MQAYRLIFLVGTLGVALMVSACDISTPSQFNLAKLKVQDQTVTEIFSTDRIDIKHVEATAHHVLRNGNEEVTLTIPYLPGGEVKAVNLGAAYKQAFAAQGVTHFSVALVAMTDSQEADKAVVSYQALAAVQPNDCGRIPGYQGGENLKNFDNYQFGCETQANIGHMVANPSDLLGTAPPSEADSRRNGAIIDPYRAGTPNSPMQGYSASSVGK